MSWPIYPIIGFVVVGFLIANHVADNPRILENAADAALVRCEIGSILYESMVDVGLNQYQMATLDAMMQGKEVAARDVRDLGGHVKHVVNVAKWDTLCSFADR